MGQVIIKKIDKDQENLFIMSLYFGEIIYKIGKNINIDL